MHKQFSKYLGYFCNLICCWELSKIAQSGHAAAADDDVDSIFLFKENIQFCLQNISISATLSLSLSIFREMAIQSKITQMN